MEELNNEMTQKLISVTHKIEREQTIPETPVPSSLPTPIPGVQVRYKRVIPSQPRIIPKYDAAKVRLLEEQCRRLCISLFFREQAPVRSLGITSAIPGEGKSFIALMMAQVLANDSPRPVTLIECDWEHTGIHNYFSLPSIPGLAEWLRGECSEGDIRHKVADNLTVIRAGDGHLDAVRLLQLVKQRKLLNVLSHLGSMLLLDLPSVTTSAYSVLAASLVEAVALVVRAGVTPDQLVADACAQLHDLPMQGIILNQIEYRPRKLR